MDKANVAKLADAMAGFENAMLVTRTRDGELRSRPMALVEEASSPEELWFVTSIDSPKIAEIHADSHVNITMQSEMRWVSISGDAQVVRDRERIKSMWREGWRVWFPEGPEETDLVLVKVKPTHGEYWDQRGGKGVRFLIEAAVAYVTGAKKDETEHDPAQHGKVDL